MLTAVADPVHKRLAAMGRRVPVHKPATANPAGPLGDSDEGKSA